MAKEIVSKEEIEKFIKENSTHELGDIEDTGDDLWCLLSFDCGECKKTCSHYNAEQDSCEAYDNDEYVSEEECPAGANVAKETERISELIQDTFKVEAYEHSEIWNGFSVFIRDPIE